MRLKARVSCGPFPVFCLQHTHLLSPTVLLGQSTEKNRYTPFFKVDVFYGNGAHDNSSSIFGKISLVSFEYSLQFR